MLTFFIRLFDFLSLKFPVKGTFREIPSQKGSPFSSRRITKRSRQTQIVITTIWNSKGSAGSSFHSHFSRFARIFFLSKEPLSSYSLACWIKSLQMDETVLKFSKCRLCQRDVRSLSIKKQSPKFHLLK